MNKPIQPESNATTVPEADDLASKLEGLLAHPGRQLSLRVFDHYLQVSGPIGPCFVITSAAGVRHVYLAESFGGDSRAFVADYEEHFGRPLQKSDAAPDRFERALHDGRAKGLALDLSVLTPFERSVLHKAQEIPRGEVRPYAWIAKEIGAPRAVRAVGTALARNPVPFVVPCHRVVRSDGTIGNYAFGPPNKQALLADEGVALVGDSTLGPLRARFVASETTKIVCYPTCRSAKRITAAHRVLFTSLENAHRARYRPCEICRPI